MRRHLFIVMSLRTSCKYNGVGLNLRLITAHQMGRTLGLEHAFEANSWVVILCANREYGVIENSRADSYFWKKFSWFWLWMRETERALV